MQGPLSNAAIVHYAADKRAHRPVKDFELPLEFRKGSEEVFKLTARYKSTSFTVMPF